MCVSVGVYGLCVWVVLCLGVCVCMGVSDSTYALNPLLCAKFYKLKRVYLKI